MCRGANVRYDVSTGSDTSVRSGEMISFSLESQMFSFPEGLTTLRNLVAVPAPLGTSSAKFVLSGLKADIGQLGNRSRGAIRIRTSLETTRYSEALRCAGRS